MGPLEQLPQRLHHYAFVVRDHEANRRFFEDVLGLPLVATWCERVFKTDVQREVASCHTFFGLAEGSALAFFQFADEEMYERRETFDEIDRRLAAAGIPAVRPITATACRCTRRAPTGCAWSSPSIPRTSRGSMPRAASMPTRSSRGGAPATTRATTSRAHA